MEILKIPLPHLHRADVASWFHNLLPTMDNLLKRKVNATQDCKPCKYHKEDIIHVFNSCDFGQQEHGRTWQGSQSRPDIASFASTSDHLYF
ncbi:hypothetical protein LIER_21845 [Lithospermum erythrorhizon]|uniref:Reverse transcriptase zinc-binding domain-containing protein n=1 Tax=Lithospermum erythrorhizon TaxID=34254 RepID=A0AAV3QV38_LITER